MIHTTNLLPYPTCAGCATAGCTAACPDAKEPNIWLTHAYRAQSAEGSGQKDLAEKHWRLAAQALFISPLPDVTGRICPALCEDSSRSGVAGCLQSRTLAGAVPIRSMEQYIADLAWQRGWVQLTPGPTNHRRLAIVGSGPAGLAAAWSAIQAGYSVTIFERDRHPGGLLAYGIPSSKLPLPVLERNLELLRRAGVQIRTSCALGEQVTFAQLTLEFSAVILALGKQVSRPLGASGEELATDALLFLRAQKEYELSKTPIPTELIASGKVVLVVGGKDTAEDAAYTALSQGAASVTFIIRKDEKTYLATREYPSAYLAGELGRSTRRYSTRIDSLTRDPATGRLIAQLNTGENLIVDLVLTALGFTRARWTDSGVDASEIRINPAKGDLPIYPYKKVPIVIAGDAAHDPAWQQRSASDLVVTAIAEGVQAVAQVDAQNPLQKNFGTTGELLAEQFLITKGYEILERNFHAFGGEVDLIARSGDEIIFVEVKRRRSDRFGSAVESATPAKLAKVLLAGEHWLDQQGLGNVDYRVDVIAIQGAQIEHFESVEVYDS